MERVKVPIASEARRCSPEGGGGLWQFAVVVVAGVLLLLMLQLRVGQILGRASSRQREWERRWDGMQLRRQRRVKRVTVLAGAGRQRLDEWQRSGGVGGETAGWGESSRSDPFPFPLLLAEASTLVRKGQAPALHLPCTEFWSGEKIG